MDRKKCKEFTKRLKKIEKIADPNNSAQALSNLTQDMRQNGFEFPRVYRRTITVVRQLIEEYATRTASKKWYQTNTFKGAVIALVVTLLGGGIPAWLSLVNKRGPDLSENTHISSEAKTSGDNSPIVGGDYVAGDKIVKQELFDTNELSKFGDSQKALGKIESELEKKNRENQELQNMLDAYKRDDKEFRAALKLAKDTEKIRVIARILEEHDKGNIPKEEALKLSDMVNKTLLEDLKSFLENKNIQINEHNQSLVVSGIFKTKITGGGYRARYNPATIVYVLTSEGNKLYEIVKTDEN